MTRFANSVTFLFGFQSQITPMAKQFLDLLLVNVSSMNFTSVSFFLGGKKIFRGEVFFFFSMILRVAMVVVAVVGGGGVY